MVCAMHITLVNSTPVIVAAVGALIYGLMDGKASEIGKMLFFAGALAALVWLR